MMNESNTHQITQLFKQKLEWAIDNSCEKYEYINS